MYKKVNVVMLPTNEKATNIVKILKDTISYTTSENIPGGIYQHLYITSDDEIKEGDYCIDMEEYSENRNNLEDCFIYQSEGNGQDHWNNKKIMASTDSSLTPLFCKTATKSIPQIPQQFIEHYVSEYNKGNIITEVMVEVDDTWIDTSGNMAFDAPFIYKLNQDNTINIEPVKDSWNREEIINLLECAWNGGAFWGNSKPNSHYFEKWIEENL